MTSQRNIPAFLILGLFLSLGLFGLGYQLSQGLIKFKEYERYVTVKGLSEREVPADIAIWPIQFSEPGNQLTELYESLDQHAGQIIRFLESRGFDDTEITLTPPAIQDKLANQYGNERLEFRYSATQTITAYTHNVDAVRKAKRNLIELGKTGILFLGEDYGNTTEYVFSGLNTLKPEMIEEATTKAREVAQKFARDSNSKLGKIRKARQGQFSIENRDRNNPHIKRIRVVSTLEYYLSD